MDFRKESTARNRPGAKVNQKLHHLRWRPIYINENESWWKLECRYFRYRGRSERHSDKKIRSLIYLITWFPSKNLQEKKGILSGNWPAPLNKNNNTKFIGGDPSSKVLMEALPKGFDLYYREVYKLLRRKRAARFLVLSSFQRFPFQDKIKKRKPRLAWLAFSR